LQSEFRDHQAQADRDRSNVVLRANSKRPLARAKPATGTSDGVARVNATVPTAAINPMKANAPMGTAAKLSSSAD